MSETRPQERKVMMNRLTVVFALTTISAVLALVASAPAAPLSGQCQPFTATAHTEATSQAGPFAGTADVVVGGTSYSGVPVVTSVLAPLTEAGGSGVYFTSTSHSIALPGAGAITTIDDARLIATQDPGVFRLVSHLRVTSGASGQLHLQGQVSFATLPFTADAMITGAVCGL
jgi:hypothetical protein